MLSASNVSTEVLFVYFIMVTWNGWSYMWLVCAARPHFVLLPLHIERPLPLLFVWGSGRALGFGV
jgi:hypothetical protein